MRTMVGFDTETVKNQSRGHSYPSISEFHYIRPLLPLIIVITGQRRHLLQEIGGLCSPPNTKLGYSNKKEKYMSQCYNSGDFKKYFTENMNALGLAVPTNLFDTSGKAIATAVLILSALDKLGKGATMAQIAGATFALEKLMVLGAMSAAGYAGAVIGSIAVATGRSLGCGYRISDMSVFLKNNNLEFQNWNAFYTVNSQILDKNHNFRNSFALKCKDSTITFRYS